MVKTENIFNAAWFTLAHTAENNFIMLGKRKDFPPWRLGLLELFLLNELGALLHNCTVKVGGHRMTTTYDQSYPSVLHLIRNAATESVFFYTWLV